MSDDSNRVSVRYLRRVQVISRDFFQRLTNVNVLQPSQIQSGTDDIGSPFREQNVPAVIALLHRLQDVRRIVGLEIVVAFDKALSVTFRRTVHFLVWTFWRVNQRGPVTFFRANICVVAFQVFLIGRPGCEGARGLEKP
jgi:hypothetical protein